MAKNLTIKFLKEEQKERIVRNTEQIKSYFLQKCENSCKDDTEYEYEKEILFLIKFFDKIFGFFKIFSSIF